MSVKIFSYQVALNLKKTPLMMISQVNKRGQLTREIKQRANFSVLLLKKPVQISLRIHLNQQLQWRRTWKN
jgi:hypothetical protein